MERGEVGVTLAKQTSSIFPPISFLAVLLQGCPQRFWPYNAIVTGVLFTIMKAGTPGERGA